MENEKFQELTQIVRRLRRECPWDREQTHASIRHSLIEETYEVVEAIDNNNHEELKKELGDLLLHVLFHSSIAEEAKEFTLEDVIRSISDKLVRRHPHVFGPAIGGIKADTAHDVKRNWEKLKFQEGRTSVVDGVPKELPALLRAHRLQDKAAKVGFDWEKKEDTWEKVEEEVRELHHAIEKNNPSHIEGEFGDLLFALVNYSRFIDVNPENALRRTIDKFIQRFQFVERKLKEVGKDINSSNLEEMDLLWEEAKRTR